MQTTTKSDLARKPTHTERLLAKAGLEVNRENYISASYMGEPPEEWTADDEALLPEHLQDWSLFEMRDEELVYIGT